MQNNAPPAPPVNVNTNTQMSQTQYNSALEKRYNLLAQKIAENSGVKIQGKINVDILAKSAADFFDKKKAMETSSAAFNTMAKSWQRVYESTDPNPLTLAMGGQLFTQSRDDEIKINTDGLNENIKREFCSIFANFNGKCRITGQKPNEFIKATREDFMKAAIIYRLRHPACSPGDAVLYQKISNGANKADNSATTKNTIFGAVTSVLSIGSTIGSTLLAFGVIETGGVLAIALMAIAGLMLIPRIVSLCRSLTRLGHYEEAKNIKESFDIFNGAIQRDGSINDNISKLMNEYYEDKERKSVELGQKYLDKVNANANQREKATGIVPPAKLNNQQQRVMNNIYKNNYPQRPIQQGIARNNLNSGHRCQCRG